MFVQYQHENILGSIWKNTVTLSINVTFGTRFPLTVTGTAFDGSSRTLTLILVHSYSHTHRICRSVILSDNYFFFFLSAVYRLQSNGLNKVKTRELKWLREMTNEVDLINIHTHIYTQMKWFYLRNWTICLYFISFLVIAPWWWSQKQQKNGINSIC